MNIRTPIPLRLLLVLLLLGVISPIAFAVEGEEYGVHYDTVLIRAGLTKEDVRDVAAMTFVALKWTVKEKGDLRVIGFFTHRHVEATVTMLFDAGNIEIYCDGWATDRHGAHTRRENPTRWLASLKKELTKQLNQYAATRS